MNKRDFPNPKNIQQKIHILIKSVGKQSECIHALFFVDYQSISFDACVDYEIEMYAAL